MKLGIKVTYYGADGHNAFKVFLDKIKKQYNMKTGLMDMAPNVV